MKYFIRNVLSFILIIPIIFLLCFRFTIGTWWPVEDYKYQTTYKNEKANEFINTGVMQGFVINIEDSDAVFFVFRMASGDIVEVTGRDFIKTYINCRAALAAKEW